MTDRNPVPAGTAACDDCDWTAEGPTRFHDAVEHREATDHTTAASLRDAPGDNTGQRVEGAFYAAHHTLRR